MRDTFLRLLTDEENNILHLMLEDKEAGYRVKIILLKDEGYTVPQIRKTTNHHDNNIRKWIHRFNKNGLKGIESRKHSHRQYKFTDDIEKEIVQVASSNPRKDYGLAFSNWSLRVSAGFIVDDLKVVDSISHAEIRNILIKHVIRWRKSKTMLSNSNDAEYQLKKVH